MLGEKIHIYLLLFFSTRYIYIQHLTFIFNNTHFLSTSTRIIFIQQKIFVQLQPKVISLNRNSCSTFITLLLLLIYYFCYLYDHYYYMIVIIIIIIIIVIIIIIIIVIP